MISLPTRTQRATEAAQSITGARPGRGGEVQSRDRRHAPAHIPWPMNGGVRCAASPAIMSRPYRQVCASLEWKVSVGAFHGVWRQQTGAPPPVAGRQAGIPGGPNAQKRKPTTAVQQRGRAREGGGGGLLKHTAIPAISTSAGCTPRWRRNSATQAGADTCDDDAVHAHVSRSNRSRSARTCRRRGARPAPPN
jgi:hypothetical protein